MSILIKGMKMPTNCGACPLRLAWCRERLYMVTRPKRCPLVEVPTPHGRLIDADELIVFEAHVDSAQNGLRFVPAEFIEAAPTIIGAEEVDA